MKPFVTNKNVSKGVVENRPRPLLKHTADGRNPAPVDMIDIPCIIFRVLYILLVLGRISEPISHMYVPAKKLTNKKHVTPQPSRCSCSQNYYPILPYTTIFLTHCFGWFYQFTQRFQFFLRFFNLFPLWDVALWKMLAPTQPTNSRGAPMNGQADISCSPSGLRSQENFPPTRPLPIRNVIDVGWYLGNLKFELYGFCLTPTQDASHK